MTLLTALPVALVAVIHVYIVILETMLWTSPRGRKAFGLTPVFAESTKVLAANQGLYNGFLAAGLGWGLAHPDEGVGRQVQLFFLGCVFVAGVFGAATTGKAKIAGIQCLPAAAGVLAVIYG